MNNIEKQMFIFGSIFLLANKLQVIGDKYLGEAGITTKQWFLMAMISQFGDKVPTLSEVGEFMGSSRQNVKQLALKLEEKGLLNIKKDVEDSRALRLELTEESKNLWANRAEKDMKYIENLFSGINEDEINMIFSGFNKLIMNIDKLNNI